MDIRLSWMKAGICVLLLATSGCGKNGEKAKVDAIAEPQRADRYTSATRTYGPLAVTEGDFDAQAATKAWSSYWYPVGDDILVTDSSTDAAPLKKLDQY